MGRDRRPIDVWIQNRGGGMSTPMRLLCQALICWPLAVIIAIVVGAVVWNGMIRPFMVLTGLK
jgi:hypothetical protein